MRPIFDPTPNSLPRPLKARLDQQVKALNERTLIQRRGIDFSSNDYLGFSEDPVLAKRILAHWNEHSNLPLGAAGSRLLRGNLEIHEKAEKALARFCSREAALLFPSGYQANLGLLSSLLGPGDLVFSDAFNHASIIDGIRLSRAEKRIYPHKNLEVLKKMLQETNSSPAQLRLIVTESVFSMDGDLAPLRELVALAREFDAFVVVDESHATGLWGAFLETRVASRACSATSEGTLQVKDVGSFGAGVHGSGSDRGGIINNSSISSSSSSSNGSGESGGGGGWVEALGLSNSVLATIHTGGKSLGCSGAWIACDESLKEYLVNFSRPFIFSTAPSPILAVSLVEACEYWREVGPERAKQVLTSSILLREQFVDLEKKWPRLLKTVPGVGPIIPLILGENSPTLSASRALQEAGYDVRAIRPPTVPTGTSRLRFTVKYRPKGKGEIEGKGSGERECVGQGLQWERFNCVLEDILKEVLKGGAQ